MPLRSVLPVVAQMCRSGGASTPASIAGSPYKTVRVNNFNKLHATVLAAHVEKSGVYNVEQGGIF